MTGSSEVTLALPIADRAVAHRFYRDVLGLAPVGPAAEDGLPEPLRFRVNAGLLLMLVPTGGFGWAIGDHRVAEAGQSECVLNLAVARPVDVDALAARAEAGGARVVVQPDRKPWGYTTTFADPDGHLWSVVAEP